MEGFYLATFEQLPGDPRFATEGAPTIVKTTIDEAGGKQFASQAGD